MLDLENGNVQLGWRKLLGWARGKKERMQLLCGSGRETGGNFLFVPFVQR